MVQSGMTDNNEEVVSSGSLPKSSPNGFSDGLKVGIPIGIGYFVVSFALGITAKDAGLTPVQSALMSLLMRASAGQYAAITVIAADGALLEMALTTLIVNLRYLLMACSLSQKVKPSLGTGHRLGMAFTITDEIFGASVLVDGHLRPSYMYGMAITSGIGWVGGSYIGTAAGNILPQHLSNALGVALYGMFLAIIIPPARQERIIGVIVAVSMVCSYAFSVLPVLSGISSGMQIIILTVVIAGIAAFLFPVKEEA